MGRLLFALRAGLAHVVWRVRRRHPPVPTLPPLSPRPRRLRDPPELLGHKDGTTMIYTHVLNKGGHAVRSPVDEL